MQHAYTAAEVANLLGCSLPTVYSYEKKGLIQKMADPHQLSGVSRFEREGVDRLKREKEQLNAAGRSITEVAQRLGVYPPKVKEAIAALSLDIQSVPSSFQSTKLRYAITKAQEREIGQYLKRQKGTRSKRNHLYSPTSDVALYQSFLLAGEQSVRLRRNEQAEFGFYLDEHEFLPYLEALRSHDLEPRYGIHQARQSVQQGFTDLVVSTGKKAFYQITDVLYAVCGVENFNAEIRDGHLVASIRNGKYAVNAVATEEALKMTQKVIQTGKVEIDGDYWMFARSDRTLQLTFEEVVYEELKVLAETEGLSLKEWTQRVLKEKREQLKNR
ncbi:helix-turn-helix domain-containing protein [Planococcus shenhongbingii]|uniref:helix-turn-helix domain-containing protein n=1 Tax=Planococcus shenhongbingii TaxID=3058398 RepID=UPI00261151F8|nr:helix-turn-helix domain-containing protein [Planococcus sp. N016]WKA60349.1 helix-turn-helix domain-containing protein [Planococcus sp. N016]